MPKKYTNYNKTSKTPRKPFDKDRLINELKIVGTYGLRNKREMWRVQLTLAKLRKAARQLLTIDESDPKRIFECDALIRRIVKLGLLKENERESSITFSVLLSTSSWREDFRLSLPKESSPPASITLESLSDKSTSPLESKSLIFHHSW